MYSHQEDKVPFEELIKRDKALVNRICSDDDFAYYFFHEKCRPLFSKILWTIYGNTADYDELVNELYLKLKSPDSKGEIWPGLKTFDYRTSLFDWIKTVAIRHFYTPSNESFTIPSSVVESGLAEELFSELHRAVYRKYMCFKYIDNLDDDTISDKLQLGKSHLSHLARNAIKQLKWIVSNQHSEYYSILFQKTGVIELDINSHDYLISPSDEGVRQEMRIDVYQYLDAMPNEHYRRVIKTLFLEDIAPEILAKELETPVSNIYNLKSRGLDQLRDVVIYFNEICDLERYIKLVPNDRYRTILTSIFLEKKDYEVVCSELKITESELKRLKKEAIKEIKNKIFEAKS